MELVVGQQRLIFLYALNREEADSLGMTSSGDQFLLFVVEVDRCVGEGFADCGNGYKQFDD